ncbi:MAG TPA: hypothetical protein PKE65_09190 [Rhizobiaceae bacterium]|nr:hypothetical protein [Rhizobiaceae bacterium]
MNRRTLLIGVGAGLVATRAAAEEVVNMRDLYNKDLSFSDYAKARAGQRIAASGFMAPPLKTESSFFVLTKKPMAVCPFCDTEADWPDDILAIYTKRTVEVIAFNVQIVVRGALELGTWTDPELGFVSRVRLTDATYERA